MQNDWVKPIGSRLCAKASPTPPMDYTRNALNLETVTREGASLKNENVLALDTPPPTSNRLVGIYIYIYIANGFHLKILMFSNY